MLDLVVSFSIFWRMGREIGKMSGDAWYRGSLRLRRRRDGIWVRWELSGISKRAYIVQSDSDMKIKLKRGISRPPSCSPRRQYRKLTFINRSITSTTSFLHSSSVRDFLPVVFLNMGFAGFIALND